MSMTLGMLICCSVGGSSGEMEMEPVSDAAAAVSAACTSLYSCDMLCRCLGEKGELIVALRFVGYICPMH